MTEEQFEEQYPESWRPDPGDTIKGTITEIAMAPAKDAKRGPYPVVRVQTADGERSVHAFHFVLRSELARRRPGLGDQIEITYMGKKAPKTAGGNEFHNYRVKGGSEKPFDWDSQLPEEERQAQASGAPPIQAAPTVSEVTTARELQERRDRAADEALQAAAESNFGNEVPF